MKKKLFFGILFALCNSIMHASDASFKPIYGGKKRTYGIAGRSVPFVITTITGQSGSKKSEHSDGDDHSMNQDSHREAEHHLHPSDEVCVVEEGAVGPHRAVVCFTKAQYRDRETKKGITSVPAAGSTPFGYVTFSEGFLESCPTPSLPGSRASTDFLASSTPFGLSEPPVIGSSGSCPTSSLGGSRQSTASATSSSRAAYFGIFQKRSKEASKDR